MIFLFLLLENLILTVGFVWYCKCVALLTNCWVFLMLCGM